MKAIINFLNKYIPQIFGFVFILSGLSKAQEFLYFDSLIQAYHIPLSNVVGISIVLGELILGLCLIFNIALRYTSCIGFFVVLFFTCIYTYGYFFLDITDCGCFGKLTSFTLSYGLFIIRNIILMIGFVWIWITSKNNFSISILTYFFSLLTIFIGALLCGNVFRLVNSQQQTNFISIPLEEHVISNYLNLAKDSTYMISILSYDCPHCINSVGNLMQYNQSNYVDEVICLFMKNENGKQIFNSFFEPNFKIIELSEDDIYKISEEYPITFFIKNDSIKFIHKGEIPSAFFFQSKNL